jgi:hypothetical protein
VEFPQLHHNKGLNLVRQRPSSSGAGPVDLELDDLLFGSPEVSQDVVGVLGTLGPLVLRGRRSSNCTGLAISRRALPSAWVTGTT